MSKNLQKLLEIKRDFDPNNPMHVNLVDNILREFGHLDNVSGIEIDHSSLLFFAAEKRCVKLVKYLVEDRKVNVDIDISHEGWTPLMIACSYYFEFDSSSPPGSGDDELEYLEEYYKIVDCLLRNSANPFKLTRSDPVHNALEIVCTNTDGPLNPLLALFVFRESQLKIYPEIFLKFVRDNTVRGRDVIEYLLVNNCLQPNQICLTKEGKPSNALVEANMY